MWLLNTNRAELHFFSDPSSVLGGYATLSHTWSRSEARPEQTFQDLQAIFQRCATEGKNPRDHVSDKIRNCCLVAERDGYEWVWVDTCCIDKTSSAELSEAINSMFNWYVLSEVCYAYLEDVGADEDHGAVGSEFRTSRWHTRGWTLQELLAPTFMVFMSRDWTPIGTKHQLSILLSEVTGIDRAHLKREKAFLDASVAERMSWAASRTTTRVEDEAYCLLGLFDVKMPPLYGEGRQAFYRLQLELSRHSIDTSLFAWGIVHDGTLLHDPTAQPDYEDIHFYQRPELSPYSCFLFASSPRDFLGETRYYTPVHNPTAVLRRPSLVHSTDEGPFGKFELPRFEITSRGMKCRLPVAEVDGMAIAVLLVETRQQHHIGLFLNPSHDNERFDLEEPMYYATNAIVNAQSGACIQYRIAHLGDDLYNLHFLGHRVHARWRDIFIHAVPSGKFRTDPANLVLYALADRAADPPPFRIPRWLFGALAALKLLPAGGRVISLDPSSSFEMYLEFASTASGEMVRVRLGLCNASSLDEPRHWAFAEPVHSAMWLQPWAKGAHVCAQDHVDAWPRAGRAFGNAERTVRLAFVRCAHDPGRTRVMRLELGGSVYDAMQREANLFLSDHRASRLARETVAPRSLSG
ncbi:HET-domain-containing protein [Epithele typhae]|uniref:HET-domain-containing protein n=1 Tax=Epithele typhae TaxID=378194 RepID=UPI0020085DA4|nr:HET-domain-containing protein [Epithele typhae]KAH9936836.1 HET-domain-containing protein [Epithele typhae]